MKNTVSTQQQKWILSSLWSFAIFKAQKGSYEFAELHVGQDDRAERFIDLPKIDL